ncbi:MAG TPA: 16S rRNA (guanine(527)-N(7))-methyltransferase RsmG [Terriglobales bacterium]|jgi:16S rRNA (guanine(527)-N(7))-methyltransferase RsmG|nr:16S rRNA (guanine(527)-N(7))-methyltransferase RsmG [Terriglobales bacterium]
MQTARISALLEPFLIHPLSEQQLNQISIYIDLLQRWNARINLTAIRTEEEIVTRHFGESLFLARHVFPNVERTLLSAEANSADIPARPISRNQCHPERSQGMREADATAESKDPYSTNQATRAIEKASPPESVKDTRDLSGSTGYWVPATRYCKVLDIGSGAGFPALPLKIWAPEIHLTLIESNHKKSAFLKEASRALTFTNVNIMAERTEALLARPDHPQAEVVTLRAVEHFEAVLPQSVSFLAAKATLALLIGTSQLRSLTIQTSMNWQSPIPIPSSNTRVLIIGRAN